MAQKNSTNKNAKTTKKTNNKKNTAGGSFWNKIKNIQFKDFFKGETLHFGFGLVILTISLFMIYRLSHTLCMEQANKRHTKRKSMINC